MEDIPLNASHQYSETLTLDSSCSRPSDTANNNISPLSKGESLDQTEKNPTKDEEDDAFGDYMVCNSGSRLVRNGLTNSSCTEETVIFVNAGSETSIIADASMSFLADTCFQGGDIFRTDEYITDGGRYPFIYQSARLGDFCYQFDNLAPGNYFVDLHFVEIINTNGPRDMRVFNVFMQKEKVLSDFDIFSLVGANKPLQLVDSRVTVKEDGIVVIRFEGVHGRAVVSGICIRRAPKESVEHDYITCDNCAADIELPIDLKKHMQTKATVKFERKIEELTAQCQLKSNECYEAWMSLNAANEQLEKVRMQLDNKLFQTYTLDQMVEKQAVKLRCLSSSYERDKNFWVSTANDLAEKIKMMKHEHSQLASEAHKCADSVPELNKMVFAVQELVAQFEDLKLKYCEEQEKRKKLYNQVQDAKGNIRVFCRCRPLSKEDKLAGHATVVDLDAAKDGDLGILTGGSAKKSFKFDRVYTPKDDQVDVYADASPMVVSVLDGYNVCIFAYGQTGTGKTFTMEGTEQNRGVNYRTLEELFEIANVRRETHSYNISVSVLEVYNEQIRDLLATSPASKKLEIKQASEGAHHVPGIVEANVTNIKEVWNVLQAGSNARAVGSNNVNEHSSRSHCMLSIMVRTKNLMNGECTKSKLWLVDLAGSERLAKTDAQGERLKEAQNINRSLSALGDVIFALAARSSHIPYRNSKLTHLLQDSLGGDSKTLMFVQISPSEKDIGETLSSLNFAMRVKGVELGPARKQIDTGELQKMKAMLDKAKAESRLKEESLRKLEESLQTIESKSRGKDQIHKSLQERIRDLESQLELKAGLQIQSENQVLLLSDMLKLREETCEGLQHKVLELENNLREHEHSVSAAVQQKVFDLENKLKEQVGKSESNSAALQHKVMELERKLKEEEGKHNSESNSLHQKIKELEVKIRVQELQMKSSTDLHHGQDDGVMAEIECNIVRSPSNSMKRPVSHWDGRRKHEMEMQDSVNNGKKIRQSDPLKPAAARAARAAKAVTVQRPSLSSQGRREQVVNDRQSKKRIWSR